MVPMCFLLRTQKREVSGGPTALPIAGGPQVTTHPHPLPPSLSILNSLHCQLTPLLVLVAYLVVGPKPLLLSGLNPWKSHPSQAGVAALVLSQF